MCTKEARIDSARQLGASFSPSPEGKSSTLARRSPCPNEKIYANLRPILSAIPKKIPLRLANPDERARDAEHAVHNAAEKGADAAAAFFDTAFGLLQLLLQFRIGLV